MERWVWHAMSVEAVFERLRSGPDGLPSGEAARRLAETGPNELRKAATISPWAILLAQFGNVLILILLAATALSAFMGHAVEAVAIAVIVVFAVLLGFLQEYRAERALEALKQMAAPTATVLRDGGDVEVPARELVPGDVVLLTAGDRVPADVRLVETVNLQVDEAALTGESVPVQKDARAVSPPESALGDRKNLAYAGTAASYGRGRAVVVATGMGTEFGKIAQMLETVETGKTPLQENLDRVGRVLALAALVVVAVIVGLGLVRGQPFLEMLLFGTALAVAVVPEALPAVVTISLAIGVRRMVKRQALVRRLPAVETLGSTSVICSDKTGTLTKDEMTARRLFVAGEWWDVGGVGYQPRGDFRCSGAEAEPSPSVKHLLRGGLLASDASFACDETQARCEAHGDPTEAALVVAAAKAGLDEARVEAEFPRVGEIPFTSETKRMTTLHQGPQGAVAFSKGAPEVILDSCRLHLAAEGETPLAPATRESYLEAARAMASEALRVLAVATKPGATLEDAEEGMTLLGLVGMIDPPRPEVKAAIRTCEVAGIRPVMITGDHPVTAQAVARELGLLKKGRVVTGLELDAMSEEEFERQVEEIEVYARVSPAHKLQVVTALQKQDHVVAMTGDGVNDAPALKKADIGIAMGITGTDVTKEAAAMTLTDDNFASIVAAVEEGRAVYSNIKKYLMFLLSSNIGEICLMAGAAVAGLPLPLSAVQILYVNLATDGLPALALAVDPPDPDLMKRRPRNPRLGIFTRPVIVLTTAGGLWSAAVNLTLFASLLRSGRSVREAMAMTFLSLVLIQFIKAYNFRSDRLSVLHRPFANRWLNLAVGWEFLLLVLIVYVPALERVFQTHRLTPAEWGLVLLSAVTVSPVLELVKWMERRQWFGSIA